jgi:hypothetical protein
VKTIIAILFAAFMAFEAVAAYPTDYMEMVLRAPNAAEARRRLEISSVGGTQTNISVAGVTNAGTAAYSNAAAFYLSGNPSNYTTQTNIALAGVTNAGNISYSNAIDFHTNGTVIVSPLQRIFPPSPQLVAGGTIALVSNTGYFCYIGKVEKTTTFARVQFQVTGAGNAAATNEVALFSSPQAPNSTVQTLTRLAGSGVQTSTGSTGIKSNVTSMAVSIAQGTHLWAGIRSASLTTQPTCVGLSYDMLGGAVFTKATVNALTNVANATISSLVIPAFSTATIAPSLRVTLD